MFEIIEAQSCVSHSEKKRSQFTPQSKVMRPSGIPLSHASSQNQNFMASENTPLTTRKPLAAQWKTNKRPLKKQQKRAFSTKANPLMKFTYNPNDAEIRLGKLASRTPSIKEKSIIPTESLQELTDSYRNREMSQNRMHTRIGPYPRARQFLQRPDLVLQQKRMEQQYQPPTFMTQQTSNGISPYQEDASAGEFGKMCFGEYRDVSPFGEHTRVRSHWEQVPLAKGSFSHLQSFLRPSLPEPSDQSCYGWQPELHTGFVDEETPGHGYVENPITLPYQTFENSQLQESLGRQMLDPNVNYEKTWAHENYHPAQADAIGHVHPIQQAEHEWDGTFF